MLAHKILFYYKFCVCVRARALTVFTFGYSCDVSIDLYIFRNLKCITAHRIYT